MKTIVACFLGLIALVTFASGSAVYADALEEGSLSILAPGAGTNGVASLDDAHCAFYSDGADNCIVNVQPEVYVQPEAVDQWSIAVSELDPSATAPAVRSMDAIPVTVVQTVTIAASGVDPGDRGGTSSAQPIPVPATQPVLDHDAKTTGAIVEPTRQSADAIVVAVVQSTTVVVPAQDASGGDELPAAQSLPPPTAPRSILAAKNDGPQ
jgi:hypothetical protein